MADFFSSPNAPTATPTFLSGIIEAFKYNLDIIPDTILVSVCIFALLLQSPSFIGLGLSLLSVNLIHPLVANFFKEIVPSSWALTTRSTGKFPGISVERIMTNNTSIKADIPSYYTMFIGTVLGWLAPLPIFYKSELDISPNRSLAAMVSLCFLLLFSTILLCYRYLASHDTLFGIFLGIGIGGILGFALFIGLYYATQRRVTNIYNFPLLSTKYGGTDPVYVCASNKTT
jgi:hypothetical protein